MWILVIGVIFFAVEAIKEFNAEKYAQKKTYNKDANFSGFMLEKHPFLFIGGIILAICIIAALFNT